jgi:nucleosome binding factor SPN SPT16 subunit
MAYMDDDDNEPVVFQRTNQAVVANSIFPELAERPFEFFADGAWVIQVGDTLVQESEDSVRDGLAELFQLPAGRGVKLNISGHVAA